MSVNHVSGTTSVNQCKAIEAVPVYINSEGRIVKVPVLLQQFSVQIPLDSIITFPPGEKVLEIKQSTDRVYLTQCRLVNRPHTTDSSTGRLFIIGFIRKTIQYESDLYVRGDVRTAGLKSLTVELPFDCFTAFQGFLTSPVGPVLNTQKALNFQVDQRLEPLKSHELDMNISDEFTHISNAFYNDQPYCELVQSEITELDKVKTSIRTINPKTSEKPFRTKKQKSLFAEDESHSKNNLRKRNTNKRQSKETFATEISGKIVLDLTLSLLQKQLVKLM